MSGRKARSLIICGSYFTDYPRDVVTIAALRRLPFEKIIDLKSPYAHWKGGSHNSLGNIARRLRWLRHFAAAVRGALSSEGPIIYVLHDNHELGAALALFSRFLLPRATVVYDNWICTFFQSRANRWGAVRDAYCYILEFLINRLAPVKLATTREYARYFADLYGAPIESYVVIPNAVADHWIEGARASVGRRGSKIKVAYWGMFLIQHGLDVAIEAAEILRNDPFEFVFYGAGDHKILIQASIREKGLANCALNDFIPDPASLIERVDEADVAFGHLKDVFDASLMPPNKLVQAMARGRVAISVFSRQQEKFYFENRVSAPPLVLFDGTPQDLARRLREIADRPESLRDIGESARAEVRRSHSVDAVERAFRDAFLPGHDAETASA